MAKIETWNLYDNHKAGDKGREWVRAGYFGELDRAPSLFQFASTPQSLYRATGYPTTTGAYAKDVLAKANKDALKPEGEGWTITGYKQVAPARAATKFYGDVKGGAAYMRQSARDAIEVPIYSRVAPEPDPAPPAAPAAPRVDPAVEEETRRKMAEAKKRADDYLSRGPTLRSANPVTRRPDSSSAAQGSGSSSSAAQGSGDSGAYGFAPRFSPGDRMSNFFQEAPKRTAQLAQDYDKYTRGSISAFDDYAKVGSYNTGEFLRAFARDLPLAPEYPSSEDLLADAEEAIKRLNKAYA